MDFDPIFGKGQELWEYHCSQGVTRMTQDISVSIAHVQEIVLYPGPEKLSVKVRFNIKFQKVAHSNFKRP